MAEDKAYIGYRRAGRRPESQQDRRASADAPLALLRGAASGVLGAPGDIESLVRMLPGLSEQTVLPTSEDVERRLPLRSVSETPLGRAVTGASQVGGGFYTGPGSPLRALAAVPSAVSRAGRDFAMAAGQPAVNVIKPKGGNWLSGQIEEKAVQPLRVRERTPGVNQHTEEMAASDSAFNRWLETKLARYIRNEMGTPEDPVRALAERGIVHQEQNPLNTYNLDELEQVRARAGFPSEGFAKTKAGREWEAAADYAILPDEAGVYLREPHLQRDPWLAKVSPETSVYALDSRSLPNMFGHLTDELRNAINPESGLPAHLLWKYGDLDKVTVPQAVQRVHDINEWRAAQKAEADLARATGPATHVVKEYPEAGFRWVELKAPEALPEGWSEVAESGGTRFTSPSGKMFSKEQMQRMPLEDALKYEGDTMGHCVGGYCPDVLEGRSRIYSLRDKKGQPHVTIEVQPGRKLTEKDMPDDVRDMLSEQYGDASREEFEAAVQQYLQSRSVPDAIVQIKGKANRAPNAEYLPYVQDFVRSGQWGRVGDLGNTGLKPISSVPERQMFEGAGMKLPEYLTQSEHDALIDEFNKLTKPSFDPEFFNREYGGGTGLTPGARGEGFAAGGLVQNAGSDPIPYDSAKIDAIVNSLREEY